LEEVRQRAWRRKSQWDPEESRGMASGERSPVEAGGLLQKQ